MSQTNTYPTVLHAEPEHRGLRLTVFGLIIVCLWLSYLLMRTLFDVLTPGSAPDYAVVLSCLGALPLGFAIVWVTEQWLKRVWHSGHTVTLEENGVRLTRAEGEALPIKCNDKIGIATWHFSLSGYPRAGRERRVSSKWNCLACEIQQEETGFVVYTFMPPKKAEALMEATPHEFREIDMEQIYDTSLGKRLLRFSPPSRPTIPVSMLRGENGRFWLAERRRWENGLELTQQDFRTFMQYIENRCQ